jgi:putative hydroxymethylpyrimidine transport system permease protein
VKKLVNTGRISLHLSFAVVLMIWELMVYVFKTPEYLIPAPSAIYNAFLESFPLLVNHTMVTVLEVLLGFTSALILSAGISLVMVRFRILYRIIWPYMVISQTIPLYILAPLFMVWFGFGMLPKVLIVVLVCFFPITANFVQGLVSTEPELDELLQIMQATPLQIMWKVRLPQAMPQFFSGLKIAATYSVTGAVLSEWAGAQYGLGIFLTRSMKTFKTAALFADVFIIILLSLLMFFIINILEKRFIKRRVVS